MDNMEVLEHIKSLRYKPLTILAAQTKAEALKLYEAKATYVIIPEIIAGEHIRHIFQIPGMGRKRLSTMGKSHFNRLLFK